MLSQMIKFYVLGAAIFLQGTTAANAEESKPGTSSLRGSKAPISNIHTKCNDTSTCRRFSCFADSDPPPTVQWSYRFCQSDDWEDLDENGITREGLKVVSDIELPPEKFGYLRCFARNRYGEAESVNEVLPMNGTGFISLEVKKNKCEMEGRKDVLFYWYLRVRGCPCPKLHLYADGVLIDPETSLKYTLIIYYEQYCKDEEIEIGLTILNATKSDMETNFTVRAENIHENVSLALDFNTIDISKLKFKILLLNETHATVDSSAISLLRTEINCRVETCLENICAEEPIPQTEIYEEKIQYFATFRLNSSLDPGTVKCVANNSLSTYPWNTSIRGWFKRLNILATVPLTDINKKSKKIELEPNQTVTLTCAAFAYTHKTTIKWSYPTLENDDGDTNGCFSVENLPKKTDFHYTLELNLTKWNARCDGFFYCKSWLKNGTLEYIQLEVTTKRYTQWAYYAIAIILPIVAILIFIFLKMRRYRKIQKQIEVYNIISLANFEKGALEHLNPNLSLDDQADLLPYDKRYEFPSERLKLGEQIGSGAFGVVLKGEAQGVFENEPTTTVAVKMVNRIIGDVYIKALATELKIMIHLGKHVNVVNLLGACTKNIAKRELLVIVEYCHFGNLRDFLLNHRTSFIDQINSETGQIDFTIGSEVLGEQASAFTYITPSVSKICYEQSFKKTEEDINEDSTTKTEECHYKADYKSINKPVCTRDLLLWSFQVARGMNYLSSRKVLHGDLAARNILLTDGNVVKICDFGLSRNMYQSDVYKKTGDEMLPVKWMAIEAITDKIFSTQSDVWSFGVVLWEIFSLARTPYPGIEYNEHFCGKLLDGYRMDSPQFASQIVYEIMLHCWNIEPPTRPSFTQLVEKIGNILDQKLREHYIDMNGDYVKMNAKRFQEATDYLSMLGDPDLKKKSFSGYMNVAPTADVESDL